MNASEKTWKLRGEVLGLDFFINAYWNFEVPDLNKTFSSYKEMEQAVEREEKKIKQAKRVKLNLPVITQSGREYTITGVHAGHGTVLTSPQLEEEGRRGTKNIYVKTPWMKQAMEELAEARSRYELIESVIAQFKIEEKQNSSWGTRQGDGTPEGLEKVYRKLDELGESMTFESALEGANKG